MNTLPSERAAIVATIDPDAYSPGAQNSDYVDMSKFGALMAIVMAGALGTDGTIAAKLQQATSSGGAGVKDITGKSITLLSKASPDDSDKQAIINLRGEELDVAGGFRYVRLVMTIGDTSSPASAASDCGAVLLGLDPRYGPADDHDLASVAEIVA